MISKPCSGCHRKLDRKKFGKSNTTVLYKNAKGETKFKGSSTLKQTQTYPSRFGLAVTWFNHSCDFITCIDEDIVVDVHGKHIINPHI